MSVLWLLLLVAPVRYVSVDLGLEPTGRASVALSNSGYVAASNGNQIVLIKDGKATIIDEIGTSSFTGDPARADVRGVNDSGMVVGGVGGFGPVVMSGESDQDPFYIEGNHIHRIPDAFTCIVNAINRRGEMVGYGDKRGFYYYRGRLRTIDTLSKAPSGNESYGSDINAKGQIVGSTTTGKHPDFSNSKAFVMSHWRMKTLPSPKGFHDTLANAINEHGLIVGVAFGKADDSVAVSWDVGKVKRLVSALDGTRTDAIDVNNYGLIVGESDGHAVVWRDGRILDLNKLVDEPAGWVLIRATGVNDRGWIVGIEQNGDKQRPFLLKPITK